MPFVDRAEQNAYRRAWRAKKASERPVPAPKPSVKAKSSRSHSPYDPEDYAEEWAMLTRLGMVGRDIIQRSTPGQAWFVRHLLAVVPSAICCRCGDLFDVQKAHSLITCAWCKSGNVRFGATKRSAL